MYLIKKKSLFIIDSPSEVTYKLYTTVYIITESQCVSLEM